MARIVLSDEFSFAIPYKFEGNNDLLDVIKNSNSNVLSLYILESPEMPKTLMSISSYSSSIQMTLDSAFYNETVGSIPENTGTLAQEYKLISYDKYAKNGKLLYRKVSSPMKGKCAVMYYFMKDGHSSRLYEVKVVGELERQELLMDIAENIANSVKII